MTCQGSHRELAASPPLLSPESVEDKETLSLYRAQAAVFSFSGEQTTASLF